MLYGVSKLLVCEMVLCGIIVNVVVLGIIEGKMIGDDFLFECICEMVFV